MLPAAGGDTAEEWIYFEEIAEQLSWSYSNAKKQKR